MVPAIHLATNGPWFEASVLQATAEQQAGPYLGHGGELCFLIPLANIVRGYELEKQSTANCVVYVFRPQYARNLYSLY